MSKEHQPETVKCATSFPGKETDPVRAVPAAQKVVKGYQR